MSVRVAGGVIHLEGNCPVEDAEPLLVALLDGDAEVELGAAGRLHMAVVQLLLAQRPVITGIPADPFVSRHLLPLLANVAGAKPFRPPVDPL